MTGRPVAEGGSGAVKGVDGVWTVRFGRRSAALGRTGTLAVSRFADQAVLGLVGVLLAWRLGVDGFVPVSVLLILNSLSVSLADFGLGNELLRTGVRRLSRLAVRRVRLANTVIAACGAIVGVLLGGDLAVLVIGGVLMWGVAGEAFIRKSALIRQGRVGRAAIGEMSGTVVVVVALVAAVVFDGSATVVLAAGLVAKHVIESVVDRGWDRALGGEGKRWETWLWFTNVVNYAVANVDYLLVGLMVSAQAFAVYSLGFRVAAMFVSQLSYVVNRVALVDFGESHRAQDLARVYRARRRQMFLVGSVAGVLTALVAPVLTLILGSEWRDLLPVIVILACAVPWRMCAPLGLNALLASGSARRVTGWESVRLVFAVIALGLGGLIGFGAFTFAAAFVAIVTANSYDRLAMRASGDTGGSPLLWITLPVLVLAAVTAWGLL